MSCVYSFNKSLLVLASSLATFFLLTLLIAIRQRRGLTIAVLVTGPILGALIGGLIVAVDPIYILLEEQLHALLSVAILGFIVGITAAWTTLFLGWFHN